MFPSEHFVVMAPLPRIQLSSSWLSRRGPGALELEPDGLLLSLAPNPRHIGSGMLRA